MPQGRASRPASTSCVWWWFAPLIPGQLELLSEVLSQNRKQKREGGREPHTQHRIRAINGEKQEKEIYLMRTLLEEGQRDC